VLRAASVGSLAQHLCLGGIADGGRGRSDEERVRRGLGGREHGGLAETKWRRKKNAARVLRHCVPHLSVHASAVARSNDTN
jgi:hypothetical protein